MKERGFKPKVPVEIMEFARKEKREDWIKNKQMKAFNLVNPEWAIKEIDVIIDSPVDYVLGAQQKGFDYYLTKDAIDGYRNTSLELRLQWLYMGNLFRMAYDKKTIDIQDRFREGKN